MLSAQPSLQCDVTINPCLVIRWAAVLAEGYGGGGGKRESGAGGYGGGKEEKVWRRRVGKGGGLGEGGGSRVPTVQARQKASVHVLTSYHDKSQHTAKQDSPRSSIDCVLTTDGVFSKHTNSTALSKQEV